MSDERPLLPEQTADDAPEPSYDDRGRRDEDPDDVERLLRERPPHYDDGG
jgi:hypothetical protein